MKKLICLKDVEDFCKSGQRVFYIDKATILTPSAIDFAKTEGIEFVNKDSPENQSHLKPNDTSLKDGISEEIVYKVLQAMANTGTLNAFIEHFTKNIQKYSFEKDKTGCKIIRGDSVKLDEFEEKNPNSKNKAKYREFIGKDDGCPMSSGFLEIENSEFEFDAAKDEIYHIIDGSLTVSIDDRSYTACSGDSIYAPKNSKIKLISPNKVKIFYTKQ